MTTSGALTRRISRRNLTVGTAGAALASNVAAPGILAQSSYSEHWLAISDRPSRSTDQAMITSKRRWVASRHIASNAGRLSRPLAPLTPWSL